MILEIPKAEIINLLIKQLSGFFSISETEIETIVKIEQTIFNKCEENFLYSSAKYYTIINAEGEKEAYFSPFHSGTWTIFLYYLSHEIYKKFGNCPLANKLFYLNKIMNSVDIFYDVELPPHFTPSHQVGTVLGRAKYGDYLYFLHNCTVGENHGFWPIIGDHCTLSAGSAIIGNCHVGNNVTLGAGCIVKNQDIPNDVLCFGQSPNLIIKPKKS